MKTKTTILGENIAEVEEYDELKLDVRIDPAEKDVKIVYMPKTVELRIQVDGVEVKKVPAKLGEKTTINMKIEHSWFIFKRYAVLMTMYAGGDPIIVRRKQWKKLGKLGWLSEQESSENLEPSADTMILILGESNAYKPRKRRHERHVLGGGNGSGADTAA